MSGLYIQLDVEYASDEEFIEAGPMAELLYIRSVCFSKRKQTDGIVSATQLQLVGNSIKGVRNHAATLVKVGLWEEVEGGWYIKGYLKRNKSKARIKAEKDLAADLGLAGAHKKWHEGPDGKPSPKCKLCLADPIGTPIGTPLGGVDGVGWPKEKTEPKPKPKPETKTKTKTIASHRSGSESEPMDNAPTKKSEIIEAIVTIRTRGESKGRSWRKTVTDDVTANHGDRIDALIAEFPDAAISQIAAGIESGDTRSLAHTKRTPTVEVPDGPKLTADQIAEVIALNRKETA